MFDKFLIGKIMPNEEKYWKVFLKRVLILVFLYLVLKLCITIFCGRDMTEILPVQCYGIESADQLEINKEPADCIEVNYVQVKDGMLYLNLSGVKLGDTDISIRNKESGEEILLLHIRVSEGNIAYDLTNGNYSAGRTHSMLLLIFLIIADLMLWQGFVWIQKNVNYTYISIFLSGFAIWLLCIIGVAIHQYINNEGLYHFYLSLENAGRNFMVLTFPVMVIFAILLSISNLSLIRHEGRRVANLLGIILSCVIVLGGVAGILCYSIDFNGTQLEYLAFNTILCTYSSIYVLMECFLLGAIICGTMAALKEPSLDVDYIIILGCMIKKDGTLFPLLRGRVDRAIEFYHKQLDATGKAAVFVPSGGQGKDEVMAEAEAMRNYLLGQGIPDEQIMMENKSRNTMQNMRFSRELIENRKADAKVAFSTTNYHVFRSGIISRQQDFYPVGMGSRTKWYFWPNAYVRECIGMIAYMWRLLVLLFIPIVLFFILFQFAFI